MQFDGFITGLTLITNVTPKLWNPQYNRRKFSSQLESLPTLSTFQTLVVIRKFILYISPSDSYRIGKRE
jgi:hypothetical protein